MMADFDCLRLGNGLNLDDDGNIAVQLADGSGLELTELGLAVADWQKNPDIISYTPTMVFSTDFYSGTPVSIGNGTLSGWYQEDIDMVQFGIYFLMGSTTSLNGTDFMMFSLPSYADLRSNALGTAMIFDSSAGTAQNVFVRTYSSDESCILADNTPGAISATYPFTWATSDAVYLQGSYSKSDT